MALDTNHIHAAVGRWPHHDRVGASREHCRDHMSHGDATPTKKLKNVGGSCFLKIIFLCVVKTYTLSRLIKTPLLKVKNPLI